MTPQERIKAAKMWIETEPNAPKHFTKAGNEECRETIHALLEAAQGVDWEQIGYVLSLKEPNVDEAMDVWHAMTALHNAMKGMK